MKKIIALLLLLLIAAAAWFAVDRLGKDEEKSTLTLNGNVDIREVDLSFRVGGRLLELAVDEGSVVRKGDVLGRLDAEPYEIALKDARFHRESLAEQLKLLEAGNRREVVAASLAQWQSQQAALANAERTWKRLHELVKTRSVSKQELDNAQEALERAQASVRSYGEAYAAIASGARAEEIAKARADVRRAEAAVERAELDIRDTALASPSDGVVLTRAVEPGSMLSAGSPVLTLSLTKPVWVRAYLEEPDLGRVRVGQKATIVTDDGRRVPGTVGFISPKAEFTPKTVESRHLRTALVYRLRVIADEGEGLNQGMPVTVEIKVDTKGSADFKTTDCTDFDTDCTDGSRSKLFHGAKHNDYNRFFKSLTCLITFKTACVFFFITAASV